MSNASFAAMSNQESPMNSQAVFSPPSLKSGISPSPIVLRPPSPFTPVPPNHVPAQIMKETFITSSPEASIVRKKAARGKSGKYGAASRKMKPYRPPAAFPRGMAESPSSSFLALPKTKVPQSKWWKENCAIPMQTTSTSPPVKCTQRMKSDGSWEVVMFPGTNPWERREVDGLRAIMKEWELEELGDEGTLQDELEGIKAMIGRYKAHFKIVNHELARQIGTSCRERREAFEETERVRCDFLDNMVGWISR